MYSVNGEFQLIHACRSVTWLQFLCNHAPFPTKKRATLLKELESLEIDLNSKLKKPRDSFFLMRGNLLGRKRKNGGIKPANAQMLATSLPYSKRDSITKSPITQYIYQPLPVNCVKTLSLPTIVIKSHLSLYLWMWLMLLKYFTQFTVFRVEYCKSHLHLTRKIVS